MKGEQFVQQTATVANEGGGTLLDFASDYPGVMVWLVTGLIAVCWYLIKRTRA